MPIIACHDGADNLVILKGVKEEIDVGLEFLLNGEPRIVTGISIAEDFSPEMDGAFGVMIWVEAYDIHGMYVGTFGKFRYFGCLIIPG